MSWLLLIGLALAKPTGKELVLGSLGSTEVLARAEVRLQLEVEMRPVDGVPMSRATEVIVVYKLHSVEGDTREIQERRPGGDACRFRVPLRAKWVEGARGELRGIVTGDPLPMEIEVMLPPGAKLENGVWVLIAPKGDVVLDLPACG